MISNLIKIFFLFSALLSHGCILFEKPLVPGRILSVFSTVSIGKSVQGRVIYAWIFPGNKPPVLILGGIHGDEPSSTDLVMELTGYLVKHPEATCGRQVVIIPKANPDGLYSGTRTNSRAIDLNRNFPADNFNASGIHGVTPQSELETFALVKALDLYRPSVVVSVHAPLCCIDPDGGNGSYKLAEIMRKVSPVPVKDLPALPGSMGSYVGNKLGLKMITYELEFKHTPVSGRDEYLKQHIKPILAAIKNG